MRRPSRLGLAAAFALLPLAAAADAPPKFTVALDLSPAAAEKLAALGEQVTVSATYAGEPTAAGEAHAVEGTIDLGEETVTRKASTRDGVPFVGRGFRAAETKWVKPGTTRVTIDAYSARRASDDNLLDCTTFDGPLKEAAAAPVAVSCRLLDE